MKLLIGMFLILPLAACTSFQKPTQQAYKTKRTANRNIASLSESGLKQLISEQLDLTAKISKIRTGTDGAACETGFYRDLVVGGIKNARAIASAFPYVENSSTYYPRLSDIMSPEAFEAIKADIGETASFNYYIKDNAPYFMADIPQAVISGSRFQGPSPGAMGPLFELHFKKDGTFIRTDFEFIDKEPWRVAHEARGTWKVLESKKKGARIIANYRIPFGKNKGQKKTKSYVLEQTSWGDFQLLKGHRYKGPGNYGYDAVEGYELGSDECSA